MSRYGRGCYQAQLPGFTPHTGVPDGPTFPVRYWLNVPHEVVLQLVIQERQAALS